MNRQSAEDMLHLCDGYREEARLYLEALDAVAGASDDDWPSRLLELFGRVDAIETRLGSAKKRWQEAPEISPALDECVAAVAALIERLQGEVQRALERVETRRHRLFPEMDLFAKTDRVRQAYRRVERLSELDPR